MAQAYCQEYMDAVDRGDQHRILGAGFSNVAISKMVQKNIPWNK